VPPIKTSDDLSSSDLVRRSLSTSVVGSSRLLLMLVASFLALLALAARAVGLVTPLIR
jgi:hypothetical protein